MLAEAYNNVIPPSGSGFPWTVWASIETGPNLEITRSHFVNTLSDSPSIMEGKAPRNAYKNDCLVPRHDISLEKLKKFWESSFAVSSLRDSVWRTGTGDGGRQHTDISHQFGLGGKTGLGECAHEGFYLQSFFVIRPTQRFLPRIYTQGRHFGDILRPENPFKTYTASTSFTTLSTTAS